MKKLDRRWSIGIGVAVGFHIFLAALIGIFGMRYMEEVPEQILEVSIGGGGGGSSSRVGTDQGAKSVQDSFSSFMKSIDDIVDPNKVIKEEQKPQQVESKRDKTEPSVSKPAGGSSEVKSGSGSGSGEGAGKGSGSGSGEGTGVGSGSGDGVGDGKGVAVTPPRVLKKVDPRYPPIAKKNDIEGTVYVKILVDKSGKVENAYVSRSSGNGALDEAAVEAAYKWKFTPAKDKYGENSRCYITMPIRFVLH